MLLMDAREYHAAATVDKSPIAVAVAVTVAVAVAVAVAVTVTVAVAVAVAVAIAIAELVIVQPRLAKGSWNYQKKHLCIKRHSTAKARRAKEKRPYNSPLPMTPTSENIREVDLLNTLDWMAGKYTAQHKLPLKCASNFASMEFPLFARDINGIKKSATSPSVALAQSWESPSTAQSKARTWDSKSHKNPCFVAHGITPYGFNKILFQ
eukprot:jgi/Psemu1/25643/gm1.25643_g